MLLDRSTRRVRVWGLTCVGVVGTAGMLAGCASQRDTREAAAHTPQPANERAAPQAVSSSESGDPSATTALTGATVSTTSDTSAWTDARILAVVVAANAADLEQATLAGERARDVRVAKLAAHMRSDDHGLGERARGLAARIGSQDSAERLEVDVEHGGFLVAMRDALPETFDDVFLRAQIEQSASLVRLIEEELLPAAKDEGVASLLREVRAGAAYHLSVARSIRVGSHAGR